ncbi:MAG: hypothetical protein ACREQ9_11490 [Candidatus Binatia bacterium]
MRLRRIELSLIALAMIVPTISPAGTTYGHVEFPKDENQHLDGLDYWWGAADVFTTAGNHYTVGIGFVSFNGYVISGHQVIPHQGPYDGSMIMTADGPTEWGHPGETPGDFIRAASVYVPGVSELLTIDTLDAHHGLVNIGRPADRVGRDLLFFQRKRTAGTPRLGHAAQGATEVARPDWGGWLPARRDRAPEPWESERHTRSVRRRRRARSRSLPEHYSSGCRENRSAGMRFRDRSTPSAGRG